LRLAIVTPWFGRELIGGAERLAWDLSRALARAGQSVDVLTTCCRSFHDDWAANYHRPGATPVDGVTVRRFRVDTRDRVAFSRANSALLALRRDQLRRDRPPLPEQSTKAFVTQGIHSRDLVSHLRQRGAEYDAVLFLPYLYGTTLDGVPLVADKAFLVPCLHDEAYAYLDEIRSIFRQARGLLFNSEGELDVAADLYGPWVHARAHVISHAVDVTDVRAEPATIKGFTPNRSRYVLFLGRGDRTKNLEFAIDAFVRFREQRQATALQFVVAGPHAHHVRSVEGVVDLGAVTEEAKASLLTYARALVQPSTNESFSRTIYEAWHAKRPVIVHADCRATAHAVNESGGGWVAGTIDEWASTFATIDESSDALVDGLGERGRAAAVDAGTWDDVATRTLAAISERLGLTTSPPIEQIVPLGSIAAAEYAASLDAALRSAGCTSAISIEGAILPRTDARLVRHVIDARQVPPADALIAHTGAIDQSTGVPLFAATPAVADALSAKGVAARLLPAPVDPGRWIEAKINAQRYDDGAVNILSLAPLDEDQAKTLIDIFELFRRRVRNVRLLLLEGSAELSSDDAVVVVDDNVEARYAAFRDAHVACALGAKVENSDVLVQALWFDLPIIAYDDDPTAADIVETCGILISREDPREAAALLHLLTADRALTLNIIREEKRVRSRYAPRTAAEAILGAMITPNQHHDMSRIQR